MWQPVSPRLLIPFLLTHSRTDVRIHSLTHSRTRVLTRSRTNLLTTAQDLRDEAKQNGGHANNKHHFSALHLARERSYQRFNHNGAERPGRSPML